MGNKRNNMLPAAGKLYDKNGNVFDLTEFLKTLPIFFNNLQDGTFEITTIDRRHHEIHEGHFYTIAEIITVPDEDELFFIVDVNNKNIHLVPFIVATSKEDVEVYGYKTFTANVDNAVYHNPVNHNEVSSNVSLTKLISNITVSEYSNKIYTDFIPGSTGIGGRSSGGNINLVDEWILKKGNEYLLRIVNNSTSNNKMLLVLSWYEE